MGDEVKERTSFPPKKEIGEEKRVGGERKVKQDTKRHKGGKKEREKTLRVFLFR